MNVFSFKDIILNNIKLKKPYQLINNTTFFDIFYLHNCIKSSLIIKTPKLIIPFKPTIYQSNKGDESIVISFLLNNIYDNELKNFKEIIKNIENSLINKLENTYEHIKNLNKKNNIYKTTYNNNKINLLKTKVSNLNNLEIINSNKEPIEFKNLPINIPVYAYIHINKVWINNNNIGITINILHIYSTEDILILKEPKIQNNYPPEYSQFFKMLEVGVPKNAIIQKMNLIGLDPSILDNNNKNEFKKEDLNIQSSIIKPNLNELILNRNNLKKITLNNLNKQKVFKPPHNGPSPPSLDNILESLKNLKKIK